MIIPDIYYCSTAALQPRPCPSNDGSSGSVGRETGPLMFLMKLREDWWTNFSISKLWLIEIWKKPQIFEQLKGNVCMQRSAKCISISASWAGDVLYSAVPSLLLSPRYPASASHLVYGPFLAARLHRNLRHQTQQLGVDIGHSYS